MEDKRALRKHWKALRDGLPPEDRARWSEQLCLRIERYARSRGFRRLGVFWPLGSEVDLRPLLKAHPDWTFYFPRVSSSHPPRLLWGSEPLEPGLWGLLEPTFAQHTTPPVDLLLVPGLAFDARGFRLGYGGGYYDALLDHLGGRIPTLAVGFEVQRSGPLPVEPLDQPVDGLCTEAGLTWFRTEDPELS